MRFDRVAVTGGSGRLGAFVVEELRAHCDVTVLDLAPPPDGIRFTPVDVLDRAGLHAALDGHDAVVHLAGIDLDTPAPPEAFRRTNVEGTRNVLDAARAHGVRRTLLCSSVTATGLGEARADFPPAYLPVDEDHPLAPRHPYGVSKKSMEAVAAGFAAPGGMNVICLRPMLVLLPHNFTLARERAAERTSRWLFYYIDPADCARAFRCALETPEPRFSTYFVTAPDTCHPKPTLEWLEAGLGTLPELRDRKLYERHPRASVFDGSRARDDLGFSATTDWPALDRAASKTELSQ